MRPLAFLASTLLLASTALAQSTDTRCTNLQQLQLDHAQVVSAEVVALTRRAGFPSKVNLIVWNPGPGIPYTQPKEEEVQQFQQRLIARGVPAFIRRPRGRDIYAACGQLKKTTEANS